MKKLMLGALLVGALGFTSCGSDDDGGDEDNSEGNCATLADMVIDTGTAYGNDPSEANCNAYKAVLQGLVDGTCLQAQGQGSTKEVQAIIDQLDCIP